ncbi:MAG: hypothetical protein KDJ16_02655 [Hyphomicrobiales bacterium]|nr:hypothetical protein [Hyphomicrobiales bacterium]
MPNMTLGRPETVAEMSFGNRFRYAVGASGRRYLFSEVAVSELKDFDDAVIILDRKAAPETEKPVWIGAHDSADDRQGAISFAKWAARATRAHIHLLAGSPDERRRIIEDLRAA